MSYEITLGLVVVDHEAYTEHRRQIRPLLEEAGGAFRYDFDVVRAMHNESGVEINRAFVVRFPDRSSTTAGRARSLAIARSASKSGACHGELLELLMDASTDAGRLFRFESFELDVRSRELRKGKDRIRLQEQTFEVLCMMLERPGELVTREELTKRLWPQGTFVDFEHSLNAAVRRLRTALGDDADNPRFVETLPRRGYRFIASLAGNGGGVIAPVAQSDCRMRLAVLPFTNSCGEAGQESFSDGLTEEVIMQLGLLGRGHIGVIARWSSMAFKAGTHRARDIGETLLVDYLLEGSVRREGDRVRITAWLVDASSETHLWTDVYERHLTDCLSVQADVAAHIAGSLALELISEQPVRRSRDVAACQSHLKGGQSWNKSGK